MTTDYGGLPLEQAIKYCVRRADELSKSEMNLVMKMQNAARKKRREEELAFDRLIWRLKSQMDFSR